ncbi:MAG: flagellar protein FlgN [Sterolibacteriaceae bacterium]|nr:flagellar protein FlgN [Candidatus Methylophosphatis haderslevensis]
MAESPGTWLARRMGDEIALLRDFVAVLEREQAGLSADHAEEIAAASQIKVELVRQLSQISTERHLALARAGFTTDRAGLDAFIARQAESTMLAQQLDRLLAVAGEADEINRINGKLIRMRMVHNQQSLGFLLGGESTPTYGRDGRAMLGGGPSGRRLTTA